MIGLVDFTKLEPGMAHETYDFPRPHRPNFFIQGECNVHRYKVVYYLSFFLWMKWSEVTLFIHL